MDERQGSKTKHAQIYEYVRERILNGKYKLGDRIPSETDLSARFKVTRVTVGRALRDLENEGLILRRRGSGSYVRTPDRHRTLTFGLLVTGLGEGEIFEPICNAIATALAEKNHRLLWGQVSARDGGAQRQEAERLCRSYVDQKVNGVFFNPIELAAGMAEANAHIAGLLEQAEIPVVLLDRDVVPFPGRSRFDLVGIDNRRAGYVLAGHFLSQGCRRIAFVCRPGSAQTVDARIAGYREALLDRGVPFDPARVHRQEPSDPGLVDALLKDGSPEAVVCGNDYTAALLIGALLRRGIRVPEDIRVSGVDDLKYARLLAVSLTTLRQPCVALGRAAAGAMLERVADPAMPGRDILLDFELVVRDSSGVRSPSQGT